MQVSGDRAQQVSDVLDGKHPRRFGRSVVSYLRGFIDFVEPGATNKSRAVLLPWWQAVVDGADRIMPALPSYRPHLDQSWNTFRDQWVPTFALFLKAAGGDMSLLDDMVSRGMHRLGSRHDAMLAEVGGAGAWLPRWEN